MAEGTNEVGDLLVQFQRPSQIKPHEDFEWSFVMTAIGGGLIEVTNDDYLNEAPAKGYQPQYKLSMTPANPKWHGWNGESLPQKPGRQGLWAFPSATYQLPDVYLLEIESYVNPAGSRNLEFDPSKQTEYTPKVEAVAPPPAPVVPKPPRIISTNISGQIVSWGSIVLPLVDPRTRLEQGQEAHAAQPTAEERPMMDGTCQMADGPWSMTEDEDLTAQEASELPAEDESASQKAPSEANLATAQTPDQQNLCHRLKHMQGTIEASSPGRQRNMETRVMEVRRPRPDPIR